MQIGINETATRSAFRPSYLRNYTVQRNFRNLLEWGKQRVLMRRRQEINKRMGNPLKQLTLVIVRGLAYSVLDLNGSNVIKFEHFSEFTI
jgi:hypothetical protein